MAKPDSMDAHFQQAVFALDAGDCAALEGLLLAHPRLATKRLASPGAWLRDKVDRRVLRGFFRKPYLLWFVAEDPIRNGELPRNVAEIARMIIRAAQRQGVATSSARVQHAVRPLIKRWLPLHGPLSIKEQLDYALRLVAWSGVAAKCGVQIELIDVLVDAGASPAGSPENALVNGNQAAAEHLVARGAPLTLATALFLERWSDVPRLAQSASAAEKQFAFVLNALNGRAEAVRRMVAVGVDVNRPSRDLYSHGTPLHHAVCSGNLEAVKVLVDAGTDVNVKDRAWKGTPLGWAEHYVEEAAAGRADEQHAAIAAYLRAAGGLS